MLLDLLIAILNELMQHLKKINSSIKNFSALEMGREGATVKELKF